MTLLEIKNLSVEYKSQRGILGEKETIHAVNNLSLDIKKGEILAVAGESCGCRGIRMRQINSCKGNYSS